MAFPVIDIPSLFEPSAERIPVFDPVLKRYGALWIPKEFVLPTAAHFLDQPTTILCLAHLRGDCQAAEQCNQVHLDISFSEVLRQTLLSQPASNCCLAHGDQPTRRRDFQTMLDIVAVVITIDKDREAPVPRAHMTVTSFWDQFLRKDFSTLSPLMRFNAARICRLHQRDACKFGMDCNNIHICRQFWATVQERSPTLSPSSAAASPLHRPLPVLGLPQEDQFTWQPPCDSFVLGSKGAPGGGGAWQRPLLLAIPARSNLPHPAARSHPWPTAPEPAPRGRLAARPQPAPGLAGGHRPDPPAARVPVVDSLEDWCASRLSLSPADSPVEFVPFEPLDPESEPNTPPGSPPQPWPVHDTLLELAEKRRLLRDGQFSLWREDSVLLAVVSQGLSCDEYRALLSSIIPAAAP